MAKSDNPGVGDAAKQSPHVKPAAAQPAAAQSTRGGRDANSRSGPTELPPQFGRYRVKKKLGGGGMGTVYLVENTALGGREEALKVPHFTDDDGDNAQARERFLREANSAAKLDHPNLCPVIDAGVQDGIYYLTMRLLKGKLLTDYTGTPQPPRKAVEIVTKLAQALEAAHARGVIHRDLKPSNIMMVAGTGPVVMDFGLAKQVRQADQKLTQSGAMLGTAYYMPPEQVKGELQQMGPASDVYSLGVILFELLTGQRPFEGTMGVIIGQILYVEPPLPSSLVPGLNPALDAICKKALAKAVAERYPSMKAFAAALMDYLRRTPAKEGDRNLVPAGGDKAGRTLAGDKADIFAAPTVAPVPPRAVKARPVVIARPAPSRRPWILGGVVVLVAALAGVYFLGQMILRVDTKAGTVLLEISQKDAQVFVDGDRITIGNPGDNDTITVQAQEGKHQLRVTKPGFEAWTDDITFRANEPYRVKISLKPKAPIVAQNPAKGKNENPNKDVQNTEKEPLKKDPDKAKKKADPIIPAPPEPLPGLKFVKAPKGTFWMGWDNLKKQSKQVIIEQDFEMAVYTVTQEQWQAVMGTNPSWFARQGQGKQSVQGISDENLQRFPVENVSWNDVQEFLMKLNAREAGRGWTYRLPSDAEWEYACRGAATSKEECSYDFYLRAPTNDLSSNQANFHGEYPSGNGPKGKYLGRPTKVGSYESNKLGLYDMHGNVWQWCSDLWDAAGSARVIRGGSWLNGGRTCRAASRDWSKPPSFDSGLGFRLARVPSGGK